MSETRAAAGPQSKLPAPATAGVGRFKLLLSLRSAVLGGVFLGTTAFGVHAGESGLGDFAARAGARSEVVLRYRDGPPMGFSGGFGEDHCQACHSSEKLNANPGKLTITAPPRYAPGQTYTVTITLKRPGIALGGFQVTARFEEDSAQAGSLAPTDGQQDRVKLANDRGIQYAYHSRPGTEPTATDVVRWTLRWTAPAGKRTVLFHVAANAANGDDSQFGDFVYTARARSRGR